jgi:hypothetical protein
VSAPPVARPNIVSIADQQAQCFDLKRQGYSVRAIAERVGMPKSTVQDRLNEAFAELVEPVAQQVRVMELERLDSWLLRLELQLQGMTSADDLPPTDELCKVLATAVRVAERRARLLGLDAPVQVDARSELKVTVEGVNLERLK